MNFLVTNDDGWGFEGIQALERVARQFGDVWVIAPQRPMSGISHQMTFEMEMLFEEKEHQSFSLSGTPADCVRVALTQLGVQFDWILSGINKGSNLGTDLNVSGTVAAAREASLFGCRAIALSQHLRRFNEPFDWSLAQRQAGRIMEHLLASDVKPGQWLNVNLPDPTDRVWHDIDIKNTSTDTNPLPAVYQKTAANKLIYCGSYKDRPRQENRDISLCFAGNITVTRHDSNHL